jgi:PBP1b-binding outer membrane lipoprotein LpoB
MRRVVILVATAAVLAGCSGQPSAEQVSKEAWKSVKVAQVETSDRPIGHKLSKG